MSQRTRNSMFPSCQAMSARLPQNTASTMTSRRPSPRIELKRYAKKHWNMFEQYSSAWCFWSVQMPTTSHTYMTRRPRRKVWIIFPALNLIASITVFEPFHEHISKRGHRAMLGSLTTNATSTERKRRASYQHHGELATAFAAFQVNTDPPQRCLASSTKSTASSLCCSPSHVCGIPSTSARTAVAAKRSRSAGSTRSSSLSSSSSFLWKRPGLDASEF
mmetsp:Transcript_18229/g.40999  ORF Transcript_18229/g.40999 Transcript_18229/m.40999 type:complete len:219 (-) Transcript_18229:225-881(-)